MSHVTNWLSKQWAQLTNTSIIQDQSLSSSTVLPDEQPADEVMTMTTPWQHAWSANTAADVALPTGFKAVGSGFMDAQSSLDLLFPHQHSSDLSQDPALASARMPDSQAGKTIEPTIQGSIHWKDSGFPPLEALRPKREPSVVDKTAMVSKPASQTMAPSPMPPMPQANQARPLENLASALANLAKPSASMPTGLGTEQQSEDQFFNALQPDLQPAVATGTISTTEGNEVMDHLIRRNRFLSNSINHLASQYFKNAQ
jgi:hypothetical protein